MRPVVVRPVIGPVAQIALGCALGLCSFGLLLACGAAELSAIVRCQLAALRVLPDDPMEATVYDAVDVIERVRACRRVAADAGAP